MNALEDLYAWERRLADLRAAQAAPSRPKLEEGPDAAALIASIEAGALAARKELDDKFRAWGLDPAALASMKPPVEAHPADSPAAPVPEDDLDAIVEHLAAQPALAQAALEAKLRAYGLDPEALRTMPPPPSPFPEPPASDEVPSMDELVKRMARGPDDATAALAAKLRDYGITPEALAKAQLPPSPFGG